MPKHRPFSSLLCAVYLAGTQATRANSHRGGGTVNDRLYLADVGLPRTVGLTVRVGYVLTEHYALSANTALCHIDTSCRAPMVLVVSSKFSITMCIITQYEKKSKSFFEIFSTDYLLVRRALLYHLRNSERKCAKSALSIAVCSSASVMAGVRTVASVCKKTVSFGVAS